MPGHGCRVIMIRSTDTGVSQALGREMAEAVVGVCGSVAQASVSMVVLWPGGVCRVAGAIPDAGRETPEPPAVKVSSFHLPTAAERRERTFIGAVNGRGRTPYGC